MADEDEDEDDRKIPVVTVPPSLRDLLVSQEQARQYRNYPSDTIGQTLMGIQALLVGARNGIIPMAASAAGTEHLPKQEGFIIDRDPVEPIDDLRWRAYYSFGDKRPAVLRMDDRTDI